MKRIIFRNIEFRFDSPDDGTIFSTLPTGVQWTILGIFGMIAFTSLAQLYFIFFP